MKQFVFLLLVLMWLTPSVHADTRYPPLVVEGGSTAITWQNDAQIDWVVVENMMNAVCAEPVNAATSPVESFTATLVPTWPDPQCLIRPGDHLFLRRYRQQVLIDVLGPYIAPSFVYLPLVVGG